MFSWFSADFIIGVDKSLGLFLVVSEWWRSKEGVNFFGWGLNWGDSTVTFSFIFSKLIYDSSSIGGLIRSILESPDIDIINTPCFRLCGITAWSEFNMNRTAAMGERNWVSDIFVTSFARSTIVGGLETSLGILAIDGENSLSVNQNFNTVWFPFIDKKGRENETYPLMGWEVAKVFGNTLINTEHI